MSAAVLALLRAPRTGLAFALPGTMASAVALTITGLPVLAALVASAGILVMATAWLIGRMAQAERAPFLPIS
jgi:hypothetical protein